ncbi:MAG: hypothetical protein U0838_12250 [Chloroflexota bacterium]
MHGIDAGQRSHVRLRHAPGAEHGNPDPLGVFQGKPGHRDLSS